MRDTLKDKNYFESFIDRKYQSIEKILNMLKSGEIKEDRIQIAKKNDYLSLLRNHSG